MGTALAVVPSYADEDWQALKATVGKGLSDAQFRVFALAARRLGLDPFARQIVPISMSGGMTPQVTIDGLRLIAQRTGQYAGQIGPQWCGKDGVWHDVWLEDGPPAAARVAVIRRDFEQPMWGVARFKSYNKGGNWGTMPDVMIAKVAESLALRKAFPQELSGVYSGDELTPDGPPDTAPDTAPRTVQHGGHTVVRETGEVLATVEEAATVDWPRLRKRLRDVGVKTMGDADKFTKRAVGKTWEQVSDDDYPEVLAVVEQYEAKVAANRAQLEAGNGPIAHPDADDNGDPELLTKVPALQRGPMS